MTGNGVEGHPRFAAVLPLVLAALSWAVDASAQQAVVPLQLSFSDPGARSAGFGGAFVAVADDATAAFANPAGLVQLLKAEVSIEARSWKYSIPYTQRGRLEGEPSGFGLDVSAGLDDGNSRYRSTGMSFLSLVYPVGDWSFAFYRHKYADLEFTGETRGLFGGSNCCPTRWYDQQMHSEQDIVSYGSSAGYRISDAFSIGFGVVYFDASLTAETAEFLWDDDSGMGFFGPTTFLPERLAIQERLSVNDHDWTVTGGFLWNPSERWHFGGVYRRGFEADIGSKVTAGVAVDYGVPPGTVILDVGGIPVEFPDIYGIGVAHQAMDGRLTLSFQWDRIEYSSIPQSIGLDDQTIDDADELHFGGEYVLLDSTPAIAFRLGAWLDPDHQMYATVDDLYTRAMLPRGDDQWHYTAGFGIATQRFQVDIAADLAEGLDTLSLSAIYNF